MIDGKAFRAVMRLKTDAICVVATSWQGERAGLTATSVCPLSDAPPTILTCVNCAARAHDMISAAGRFSINLLTADQSDTAKLFSGASALKGDARFNNAQWRETANEMPVLDNALASLDCKLIDQHVYSTHSIFVGAVENAVSRDQSEPLIYFRGNFRAVD